MNKLRILVADDHEIVRRGLVFLIKSQPNWEVCAEAENGRQAVELASQLKPNIVVLDIGMPMLNGLEATRQILRDNPQTRVLILTITDTDEAVRVVLDAGARGFLLKSDAARDLLAEGRSTKEVASHLDLSVKTAETHRSNIMRKLGLHSVSELVLYAVRNSIVQVATGLPP